MMVSKVLHVRGTPNPGRYVDICGLFVVDYKAWSRAAYVGVDTYLCSLVANYDVALACQVSYRHYRFSLIFKK